MKSSSKMVRLAQKAEKKKKKQAKKMKQSKDSEIAKANACEPRVTVRRLDGATEMVIKPYPLTDYARDVLTEGGGWIIQLLFVIVGIGFVSTDIFSEWGSEAWLYKIFILIGVYISVWTFFTFRYSKIYGTLGLRITDPNDKGKSYYFLFRKDPAKPIKTGRYKGNETDLHISLEKHPAWGELRLSNYQNIYDLIPADQKTIKSFFKQFPFPKSSGSDAE